MEQFTNFPAPYLEIELGELEQLMKSYLF